MTLPYSEGENRKPRPGRRSYEPTDKESFGYILWHILGGMNVDINEAASRLKIHNVTLSAILHSRHRISRQLPDERGWRVTLAAYYPEGWGLYRSEFEKCLDALTNKTKGKLHNPADRKVSHKDEKIGISSSVSSRWKVASGQVVKRVLDEQGEGLERIIPKISVPVLKKADTWRRIINGDNKLAISIFRDAISELCELYHLDSVRLGKYYAEAQKLSASL